MLFKSGLVTQVSGSVGGMTGSHNKGGMYLKARSIPVNPGTPAQTAQRNRFQSCSTAWTNQLNEPQRNAWNQWATQLAWTNTLGDTIQLSGQNVYIGGNSLLLQAAGTRVDVAPTITSQPASDLALTSVAAGAVGSITYTLAGTGNDDWIGVDGSFLLTFVSRAQSAGRTFFKGPWRLLEALAGDSVTPPSGAQIALGPFAYAAGDKVFLRSRVVTVDARYSFAEDLGSSIAA